MSKIVEESDCGEYWLVTNGNGCTRWVKKEELKNTQESTNTQPHYKGIDSLYKFCEEWGLNAYEFDIIKRIVRCRHKGEFTKDLQKTKAVIDIYLKEYE